MQVHYDKNQKYFLATTSDACERILLAANPKWTSYASTKSAWQYTTEDHRAARVHYGNMDAKTKRYIDRIFVKRYSFKGKLPKLLDAHQKEGVLWALTRSRSYLAHAPGAGKTLDAIVIGLLAGGEGQTVFIVPPSLTVNWEREVNRFTTRLDPGGLHTVSVIPESKRIMEADFTADFIIVPDSMLGRPWVLQALMKLKIKLIAVDEASRFKEPTAARTVALFGGKTKDFKSPGLIYDARHAVLLDGSPMPNRSIELWAPTFAMAPEAIDFMTDKQFAFVFCDPKQNTRGEWEFKGSTNSEDLKRRLQESFMHVVPEERLGHSPRLRSIVFVSDERTRVARTWEKKWLRANSARGLAASLAEAVGKNPMSDLAIARKNAGLAMVNPGAKYIRERLETGEAVLVFAWHREVVLALARELKKYKPGIIMGGTHKDDREASLRSFQGGKLDLLIMNIAAGGRGHNIQRADRIIFAEPSWSDEQNIQCEKRASRRGRNVKLPVKSDYLVNEGSINEMVLSSCFTKQKRVKAVIG